MEKQKILIMGATGFVGQSLVKSWVDKGYQVYVVGRSKQKMCDVFGDHVQALSWDEFEKGEANALEITHVVNLAGAGIAEKRWTEDRKKEILSSRIHATQQAVRFCLKKKIPLLNASAVGIYGLQEKIKNTLPPQLSEEGSLPSADEACDFLSEVCRSWEAEAQSLEMAGIRTVYLRMGVVLGQDGGALSKMAVPFYMFAGGPVGSGDQAVSWIALEDVCRAINFVIDHSEVDGPVNLVAPHCVTQRDLAKALGGALNRPSFMPTPGIVLKIILGQMADELLLNGQHVYPQKLLDSGFKFKHEAIEQAFQSIYQK